MVLFLGIFLSISLMRSNLQLRAIDLRRASLYAFYAAEAGIDNAIVELRKDPKWQVRWPPDTNGISVMFTDEPLYWHLGQPGQEQIGAYTVRITDGGEVSGIPTVWIESVGYDIDRKITPGRRIFAKAFIQNPATFFALTVGDLVFQSGSVSGTSTNPVNILARDMIFEVDYSLPEYERDITVYGDLEYIRSILGQTDPYVTITGTITQRAPITFVGVDLEYYRKLANPAEGGNGRYEEGDFTYSGTIDKTSLSAPNGLVYVKGDLYISGDVTESMHFVVEGNIYIEDSIICNEVDGVEPQIGLSASANVIIPASAPSDIEIDAMITADGGRFYTEDAMGIKTALNFEGVIVARGQEGQSAIDLLEYYTRNYLYDSALRDNPTIPFIRYLVNLMYWKEVSSKDSFPPT